MKKFHDLENLEGATIGQKAAWAKFILEEAMEKREELYALAAAIVDRLSPNKDGEYIDAVGFRLSSMLENELGDTLLTCRVHQCLESIIADTEKAAEVTAGMTKH